MRKVIGFLLLAVLAACKREPAAEVRKPRAELSALYEAGRALADSVPPGGAPDPVLLQKLRAEFAKQIEAVDGLPEAQRTRLAPFATRYSRVADVYEVANAVLNLSAQIDECKLTRSARECRTQFEADAAKLDARILEMAGSRLGCGSCDTASKTTGAAILARALELHAVADRRLTQNQP